MQNSLIKKTSMKHPWNSKESRLNTEGTTNFGNTLEDIDRHDCINFSIVDIPAVLQPRHELEWSMDNQTRASFSATE